MSLFARLFLLVLLALLPAVGIQLYNEVALRRAGEAALAEEAQRLLHLVAGAQADMIEGVRHTLAAVAETPSVRARDAAGCRAYLARLADRYPDGQDIHVTDAAGTVRCSTEPRAIGVSLADRSHFRAVMAQGGFAVGDYVVRRATGRPALPFALAYADSAGARAGMVAMTVDLDRLERGLADSRLPAYGALVLTDRNGVILARLPDRAGGAGEVLPVAQQALLTAPAPGVAELSDGAPRILAYAPVGAAPAGLFLAVALDHDEAMRALDLATRRGFVLIALGALASAGAAWFGGRAFIRRPTAALAATARRWYGGDYAARARIEGWPGEFRLLGAAFNDMAAALQERRRLEERSEALAGKMAAVLESTTDGVFEVDRGWRLTFLNRQAKAWIANGRDLIGTSLWEAFPEAAGTPFEEHYRAAMDGRTPAAFEAFFPPLGAWFAVRAFPSRNGIAVYFQDVTARRRSEEQLRLMMGELDHRVKNTLAAIQSMVQQTARSHASKEDFAAVLQGRLAAMARAQSLLTQSRWEGAALRAIVAEELTPYGGAERGHVAGPDLLLKPKAALAMSMVIHELTTNAAKYGALSAPAGRVQAVWRIEGKDLVLCWIETGGPAVEAPTRRGFGSALVERTLGYEFGGGARLDFAATGLRCEIRAPLQRIVVEGGARALPAEIRPPVRRNVADLAGARILVVEDAMLLGLYVETILSAGGMSILGPATNLADALRIARDELFDAAILDVNLDGDQVYPVADLLLRRGVPFLFATGYDSDWALPEKYRDCRAVQKPFAADTLLQALGDALTRRDAA